MQEKSFKDKKEIRSLLLTYPHGVSFDEFLKVYRGLLGKRLPSRSFGFSSDVAFLQSMPDVVSVSTDKYGKIHLIGLADETCEHIQQLVCKQKKPPKKSNNEKFHHRFPSHNVRELKPFLPGPIKAEILQLMVYYPAGITFPAFTLAYRRKYKKVLPLVQGFDTLEGMIRLIPQLEVRVIEGEKRICYRHHPSDNESQTVDDQKKSSPALTGTVFYFFKA